MNGATHRVPGIGLRRSAGAWLAALAIAGLVQPRVAGGQGTPPVPPADSATRGAGGLELDSLPTIGVSVGDVLYFPGLFGFRAPAYDRTDGLSVVFGPRLALPDDRIVLDALATYRSNLGRFDPSFRGVVTVSRHVALHASAERATLTNDDWSASTFTNSLGTLFGGSDGRNYFRSDRAEATLEWHADRPDETLGATAYVGARDEYSRSIGPDSGTPHEVWSAFDHADREGILRPNPPIQDGHIASGIAGLTGHWASPQAVTAVAKLGVEVPWTTPDGATFAQFTADASLAFRGLADHEFTLFAHALVTAGGVAPPQRYSYVGGTYTLPTLMRLEQGGDQLLAIETMYLVPVHALVLPFVGAPTVAVRYVIGAAGVHTLPDFTQNVGLRLQLFVLRVDGLIDPITRKTAIALSGAVPRT